MSAQRLISFGIFQVLLVLLFLLPGTSVADEDPDLNSLPEYSPGKVPAANLTSVGSDSMGLLLRQWIESYKEYQPTVAIEAESEGSSSAPPALLEKRANLAPMVRPMKSAEKGEFLRKFGFEPMQIKTALSVVGVFVSPANPGSTFSFSDLDLIFSLAPSRSTGPRPLRWKDLGVAGEFGQEAIVPAVIGKESYAAAFFRQQVLLQRPYLRELRYLEDFTKAEALVKKHPGVIIIGNLSGRGGSSALKAAAVGRNNGSNAVFPERPQIFTGEYPLARFLNIYLVREPGEQLDPSLLDFLRFVLSRQGQTIAVREGLYPLSLDILQAELANL